MELADRRQKVCEIVQTVGISYAFEPYLDTNKLSAHWTWCLHYHYHVTMQSYDKFKGVLGSVNPFSGQIPAQFDNRR